MRYRKKFSYVIIGSSMERSRANSGGAQTTTPSRAAEETGEKVSRLYRRDKNLSGDKYVISPHLLNCRIRNFYDLF